MFAINTRGSTVEEEEEEGEPKGSDKFPSCGQKQQPMGKQISGGNEEIIPELFSLCCGGPSVAVYCGLSRIEFDWPQPERPVIILLK